MTIKERLEKVHKRELPHHLGIIMDGNGRWAKKRGRERFFGHRKGVKTAKKTVEFVTDNLSIPYLTLYVFSSENWGRPQREVNYLMNLLHNFLNNEMDDLIRNGIKLRVLGEMDDLPRKVVDSLKRSIKLSKDNKALNLNLAINYGGRQEILTAVEKIIRDYQKDGKSLQSIGEDLFSRYLYTCGIPDPDLIIRTSGEYRISNFLLWQSAYSEFWVTDTMWPDFSESELLDAIEDYQGRKRKYGRVINSNRRK